MAPKDLLAIGRTEVCRVRVDRIDDRVEGIEIGFVVLALPAAERWTPDESWSRLV